MPRGRTHRERKFQARKWKKRICFWGRDYLWLLDQPRWMKNHWGQLKHQDLEKSGGQCHISPKSWLILEKSTDGEKMEEEKCSFLFCCWTLCDCSLYCPDSGTTVFKSSVNPGVSASSSTLRRTPALKCSKNQKLWERVTERKPLSRKKQQWRCRNMVKI